MEPYCGPMFFFFSSSSLDKSNNCLFLSTHFIKIIAWLGLTNGCLTERDYLTTISKNRLTNMNDLMVVGTLEEVGGARERGYVKLIFD